MNRLNDRAQNSLEKTIQNVNDKYHFDYTLPRPKENPTNSPKTNILFLNTNSLNSLYPSNPYSRPKENPPTKFDIPDNCDIPDPIPFTELYTPKPNYYKEESYENITNMPHSSRTETRNKINNRMADRNVDITDRYSKDNLINEIHFLNSKINNIENRLGKRS